MRERGRRHRAGDGRPPAAARPAAVPASAARPLDGKEAPAPQTPAATAAPAARALPVAETQRRYRQTIHRVDLWSVLKISVCFYICGMAVTMVALVALWAIADAAGVIHERREVHGRSPPDQELHLPRRGDPARRVLVSAVLVVLQIVITVIAAAFYNVFAELFGGIEMTISEDESAL